MSRRQDSRRHTFVVQADEQGLRLDVALGRRPEMGSRSQVAELVRKGAVTVDGRRRPKSYLLAEGETVVVSPPQDEGIDLSPQPPAVPVLYEDEWLLVADKPAGMPVHPSRGHSSGTLVHALLGHGLAGGDEFRPGVVHRLDKDTTGLLVVAKSAEVHRRLVAMMRRRAVDRRYLALVHGGFSADSGTIEAPVGWQLEVWPPGRRAHISVSWNASATSLWSRCAWRQGVHTRFVCISWP
jgi:23S rRNA pseudouridine1911/1915/1917 synthase